MKTKTVTIRMNMGLYETLLEHPTGSLNQTIVDNLSFLNTIVLQATQELYEMFTKDELEFLAKTYDPRYINVDSLAFINEWYGYHLDACFMDRHVEKNGIDIERLKTIITTTIKPIHMKALFWWCEEYKKRGISFEDYQEELIYR